MMKDNNLGKRSPNDPTNSSGQNAQSNLKILNIDLFLIIGLVIFIIYKLVDNNIGTVPDMLAYPWMIVSVILMLIGAYREGKWLGTYFKSNK